MLLAVDIGNTNIVVGLYDQTVLKYTFRMSTVRGRTSDEYWNELVQMMSLRGVTPAQVHAAIVASVVPPITEVFVEAVRLAVAREPLLVGGPGLKTGIAVLYETPHDVGADRIVNAVAAYERVRDAVIVVDFGTATTIDCVSAKAEYLGGVIAPGVEVSIDALLARAAKLRAVEIAAPPRVLGRTTAHSLQSGIVHGFAALVDGLVERLQAELGVACEVIATGGLARLIVKHTKKVRQVDEHLTLEGLR
ncbi:MAG TPA: type III pantothenate kinase, partial [Polyangiaceae bacterium]